MEDLQSKILEERIAHNREVDKLLHQIDGLKICHVEELIKLRSSLSQLALDKAEASIIDKMEQSNHKYSLLKDQSVEFTTKTEMDAVESKVDLLAKMVYVGVGGLIVIEVVFKFFMNK